uniref:Clip domain-containing protein n=1 Tax=Ascaris lumbricoides TaxID=6252 RepID=A0A0M3HRD3_ASCLU
MSILHGLLILTLQFHLFSSEIPLAPYSVKLYCRMGTLGTAESRVTSVCPVSSTSCGYFEFNPPSTINSVGVYECVDSSVLVTENDDNEKEKEELFKRYCDDRSRCRVISADMLNDQFLRYLLETQRIHVERPKETNVKFCCAINDALLDKVIHSGLNILPTFSTALIKCNGEICNAGAIGCLVYSKEVEQAYVDEIILVRPAQLEYDDNNEQLNEQSIEEQYAGTEYSNEYHCVYRHFNDEFYRYCILVYNERLPGRCYEGNGYRVCCCFVPSG